MRPALPRPPALSSASFPRPTARFLTARPRWRLAGCWYSDWTVAPVSPCTAAGAWDRVQAARGLYVPDAAEQREFVSTLTAG